MSNLQRHMVGFPAPSPLSLVVLSSLGPSPLAVLQAAYVFEGKAGPTFVPADLDTNPPVVVVLTTYEE